MDKKAMLRTSAVVLAGTCLLGIVTLLHRHSGEAPHQPKVVSAPSSDDLSAELKRCNALGPQDPDDPACRTAWEENRRRFFGRSVQPLMPATSVTPSTRSIVPQRPTSLSLVPPTAVSPSKPSLPAQDGR